ncbi:hypothetical protein PIB30_111604, partial [Stylosanthes scabra]|nr:hypothetical protein [Stylosanthes scabra]
MTHPLHPFTQPSLTTHAYAYIPTPMRGTLIHRPTLHAHNYTDHAYVWWNHARPRLCVVESRQITSLLPSSHAYACHPTHMHGNHICTK